MRKNACGMSAELHGKLDAAASSSAIATGLFAKAVHEFRELLGVEGWLAEPSWLIESGPFASGWFYDFLAGVFGWSSDPERVRVIAYLAYLVPVSIAFFAGGRRSTATTAPTGTPTRQVPASV